MPLFKSQSQRRNPSPPPQTSSGGIFNRSRTPPPAPPQTSSGGIFHRSRTPPPPPPQTSSGGIFHRNRTPPRTSIDSASSSGSPTRSTQGGGGFLGLNRDRHGLDNDPSIRTARQKVADAERAEREADEALLAARRAADGAREQVKMLEREAIEEARRAKAKQAEAKIITKSAKGLGRH